MSEDLLLEIHKIAASASFPPDCRFVGIEQIAILTCYSESHVKHKIICAPDFPSPSRVGHPRWKLSEVVQWMDDHR